jgi:hypothetical protein
MISNIDRSYHIKRLKRTCTACPSQWEGHTDDRSVYIRYRGGNFSVQYSPPGGSHKDAVSGEVKYFCEFDDPYDGYMEDKQLREILEEQGLASDELVIE